MIIYLNTKNKSNAKSYKNTFKPTGISRSPILGQDHIKYAMIQEVFSAFNEFFPQRMLHNINIQPEIFQSSVKCLELSIKSPSKSMYFHTLTLFCVLFNSFTVF